ncbi:MAG: SEC-C metal-binding domain-containing protein [Gaiellaceae bacterium]
MRQGRNDPCPCGSGVKYKRCCGADLGRRAALVDVRNAAAFMPALRPSGCAAISFCDRAAQELGENDGSVPDDVVAVAAAVVDAADRAKIVATFREAEPEVWGRLREIADYAERELVASAIRGAICDRRPVPRAQLLVIEMAEEVPDAVGVRLGAVLPSGAVWSVADAEAVLHALPPGFLWRRVWEPTDGPLFDRVDALHVERVRLLCDALHRHLPLPSLPRASRIVLADCEAVLRDEELARRTAATLLLSHASYVAASAIEGASPN